MAIKSLKIKQKNRKKALVKSLSSGKKPHHPTKVYNRCGLCGRIGGYMRRFDLCRICFREHALKGLIPGVTKSSW